MLLLLALLGCNPESPVEPGVHAPPGTGPATIVDDGRYAIATTVNRDARPARTIPPPPPMPTGGAIYTDCGAGPWPLRRSGGEPEPDAAAEAPPPPPAQPTAKPQYRPTPRKAPTSTPSAPQGQTASGPPRDGGSTKVVGGLSGVSGGGDGAGAVSQTEIGNAGSRSGAVAPATETAAPVVADNRRGKNEEQANREQLDQLGYVAPRGGEGTATTGDFRRTEKAKDRTRGLDDADGDADPNRWSRDAEDATAAADEAEPIAEAEPVEEDEENSGTYWDFGATVHLSNDDSMSLASAQRVLFQVMNGRRPKLSEIRPHELLNYFSFDTVPVPDNHLFSVLGAAEQTGDTLSVAMAVQGGVPVRQPLDLTVTVDRSGSMAAEGRMSYTRRGLEQMADQLQPGDRIDLVLFESRVCTTLQDFVVGRDDPALLKHAMNALVPMGSTDLDGGLEEAYRLQTERSASEVHGRNRRVMLITDAFLNTGSVDPDVVSQIGASFDEHDVRLTGVGVGRDFNDEVLDKLTEKGKGAYVYLGSEAVVDRVFGSGFDSLVRTIAHDVRFSLDLPPSLAMERFYGEEASTDPADIQPINYYAGTSQVFLQDLHVKGGELVLDDPVVMRIAWRDAATGEPDAMELHTTVGALVDGDRRNLHKAQALMAWSDWTTAWAMGADACGMSMDTYAESVARVTDDAELNFLSGLTQSVCGRPVVAATPVAYKVRVDSDIPIAEVGLYCSGKSWSERLGGGDTVARFDQARPGSCTLTLHGNVAMQTAVKVPETGGDVRCTIRGGRMSCG